MALITRPHHRGPRAARAALLLALVGSPTAPLQGQQTPRALDHADYTRWSRIRGEALSLDGAWLLYTAEPEEGDAALHVRSVHSATEYVVPRGTDARFTADTRQVVFRIHPLYAELQRVKLERARAEESKAKPKPKAPPLPHDSIGVLDLSDGAIFRAGPLESFELPEDSGGVLAYLLETGDSTGAADTSAAGPGPSPAAPPPAPPPGVMPEPPAGQAAAADSAGPRGDRKQGAPLMLRDLTSGRERRYNDVVDFALSRDGRRLAYATSSRKGDGDGVWVVETRDGSSSALLTGLGDYRHVAISDAGDRVAFVSNRDAYAAEAPRWTLYARRSGDPNARPVATGEARGLPSGWGVSPNAELAFSPDGERLYFGSAPLAQPDPPVRAEDDRVNVNVWSWTDGYIQPMQLKELAEERKRSYLAVALPDGRLVQLETDSVPDVELDADSARDLAVGRTDVPYRQALSWDDRFYDYWLIDVRTGERRRIAERVRDSRTLESFADGRARLSPAGRYVSWYDADKGAWEGYDVRRNRTLSLSAGIPFPIRDELNDQPTPAAAYGSAGWTVGDRRFLVYDNYDLWAVDPTGREAPRAVTEGAGRRDSLRLRRMDLDPDEPAVDPAAPMLLAAFNTATKAEGFFRDRVNGDLPPQRLLYDDRSFSRPLKAARADVLLYARQSFREFPDLWVANTELRSPRKISDVNPQQSEYRWGTAELVSWRSAQGTKLQGVLYEPDGFDPSRKYPLLVYFYERLSDRLHQYIAPAPGSSSINISFYVSRGYLVFTPDIPYQIGYPGESAVDAIVPGVLSLVRRGFVDEARIGVQGHSWGGYQTAYMVTKTNMFAAAEAGAPVANMTSAYGGIRWGTGMSREFQYEHTQSRLGGTLWEMPMRYLENSPLFSADRIQTPLLMMHNDSDTAVPWQQGIEMFMALRRLQKPAWLVVYNGEPHGLSRLADRKDWAIRLQQFFDHFLKGAPAPVWLVEGVPAIEKGRTLGLDLVERTADESVHH